MNNSRPILHISIYYQGNCQSKNELRKKLSAYSKRLVKDTCNPFIDISIDTFNIRQTPVNDLFHYSLIFAIYKITFFINSKSVYNLHLFFTYPIFSKTPILLFLLRKIGEISVISIGEYLFATSVKL